MDLEHVQRLAQAFAQGVAFARGFTEMAQDAKDGEEEGHWVTIGGERGADGEKHGGRPVFISGSGTIKKGLSKSAQGKTLGQVFGKGGEFSSEGKKSKGETDRKAGERASTKKQNAELNRKLKEGEKAGNIQFPRNEFRERAKVYTEQANQVINDDLKPSVDKLGSTIRKDTDNARMPQSTLDDLTDIHNLAKQIGPMANKLNKYNEKYAAEHDDPSNYVISSYGAATKGTAEMVAKLARRAAAMSNQLTAPDDERDYSEGRAKQEIRDILSEMRGLHGDLLKKTRHAATAFNTSKPSSRESERVDAMYAQKGGEKASTERASTKRAEAEKARKDATSRAKEFRQETKQIVANDLEPSVAKLKKALDANVPARVHDDLVDTHRLADQIGIMANKLCSLNSRWAENSKEPSAFVVSSHGQNAKGTAERVAKLARRSAAMAHDFGKPRGERFSYSDAQVASEIRDNLSELRGLHQDLLDHIRRIQEPEKREEPQEDPLYAARGKVINGPARTGATARGYVR